MFYLLCLTNFPQLMECLSPIRLKAQSARVARIYGDSYFVPCGKCPACIDRQRKQWFVRIKQEYKHSINSFFVTLTYHDSFLPRNSLGFPTFCKRDIQKFIKRLRFNLEPHYKKYSLPIRLRYFFIGEYGSKKGRPHWHGIFFNVPPDVDLFREIFCTWKMGRISVSECNYSRIGYCANYMYGKSDHVPDEISDETNKLPLLSSRKPGIGGSYLTDDIIKWHLADYRNYYQDDSDNKKYPLPRFWSDKIFNETEKAIIYRRIQKFIKEHELDDISREIDYYQNHGQLLSVQRKEEFVRKFYARVKKHKSKQVNNEYF